MGVWAVTHLGVTFHFAPKLAEAFFSRFVGLYKLRFAASAAHIGLRTHELLR